MENGIKISLENLIDNQSKKFNLNFKISSERVEYADPTAAKRSKVATKIFGFPWTQKVVVGNDYLIITKQDWVDWDVLAQPLSGLIKEHFQSAFEENPAELNLEENPKFEPPMPIKSVKPVETINHPLAAQVRHILDNEINPSVAMHGGRIVLIDVKDDKVFIQMTGGCQGCSSSTATLKQGVETTIKSAIPAIKEVVDVTDHTSGENPYYS